MRRASFELNAKEQKVLGAFPKAGSELTIEEMARKAFDVKRVGASPTSKGNSWVRNSVRKLLRLKLLKGGDKSGKYVRTEVKHEDLLKKIDEEVAAKAAKAAAKAAKGDKGDKAKKPAKAKAKKTEKPAKPKASKPKAARKKRSAEASKEEAAEAAEPAEPAEPSETVADESSETSVGGEPVETSSEGLTIE